MDNSIIWCSKQVGGGGGGGGGGASVVGGGSGGWGCYPPPPKWRKLMRKLKKESKRLCWSSNSRGPAFDCYYDPLSYAQNFDRASSSSDSSSGHLYAFSARFAVARPPPPPQIATS
ncbi:hypothetical protein AMTRI_Chr02g256840 [Amborella trichopoda]|uniref:Uncharacterized protein n=1 Tax=Amborella trichopoda TaxID=13333 RepID=U5DAK2_AMBTC|nr:hypothetical protein AMTR_s00062p00029800 [Amborella trichopoda]